MKRLASLLLVAVLVVSMVPASLLTALAADVTTISPALQDEAVPVFTGDAENDTFAVDFNLDLADGLEVIAGYEVEISWDSSVLAYDSLATFGSGIVAVEEGESSVRLAVANATDVLSGRLFTVDFCTLAAGDTTVTVEVLSIATASGLIEAEGGSLDISIVDGRPTNVALNKPVLDAQPRKSYKGYLTDGYIQKDEFAYNNDWFGFYWNASSTLDSNLKNGTNAFNGLAIPTVDLGAVYDLTSVRSYVFLGDTAGITAPESLKLLLSVDGVEYTEIDIKEIDAPASGNRDMGWIEFVLEEAAAARYVRIETKLRSTFAFMGEIEVYGTLAEEQPVATPVIGEGNLALYKSWYGDDRANTDYLGYVTDGLISEDTSYNKGLWYGFDDRLLDDGVATMILDLGAVYSNIGDVQLYVWPANNGSGIVAPDSYTISGSADGVTYTELGVIADIEKSDPRWIGVTFEEMVTARYIKIDIAGSDPSAHFWFVGEIEVNAVEVEIPVDPEPEVKPSVSVEVVDGSVAIPAEDALAKLFDGNLALDATAFGDAGLVAFQNTGFTHGVDEAVPATVAITLDLGEVKNLSKVSLSAYKELNSMIALPEISFEVSVDGVNFYQINAGGIVKPAADAAESTTATLTADFSTRIAVEARYVRAIASFVNGWIFVSEISVTEAADTYTAVTPDVALPYTDSELSGNGMGVFDAEDGTLDLAAKFKNSQLIKAVYDEAKGAYKIIYSNVNPWPNGQSGYETMGDHEILVAINTGGALVAEVDDTKVRDNLYCAAKWLARGLVAGDYLVFDAEAGTASFYPAEGEFEAGDCITTVKEPVVEETHTITISHVNAYNWECYYEMVVVGEGKVATDIYNGNYTNWIAFKVENIDEIYTVTAIEGKGVAKTLVAPADGFLVYCASNDAASFAAAGLVEVGDVLLSCDFNWRKNGASATPVGTMVFGPQPSKDHDHEYTSKVTKEPTLAAEGEMLYVCVCGERYTEAIPAVKAQPDELVELPEGAYTLDYAGYKHAAEFSIVAGSGMTVSELTALGNNGAAKDMNYAYIVVVDANGKVVKTWFELAVSKAEVVCPAGGYIISYNGNKAGYEVLANIEEGCTITLYNVDIDAIDGVAANVKLTNAGFTVVRPEADVVIDVNENELLTDGNTGYTEGWDSTSGKVVLAQNKYCTTVGMNVTLLYALEETKKIESVTVDFYFDKNVMIGYPEGTATVLVSTDGETYTKVGTFDLAEADLSAPGTVSNLFKFEGVDAAFVKVEFFVGSNEDVLGDSPADGKIFWEFISVAEFAVAEAPVNLAEGKGWTGDTNIGSSYVGDITDGKIDPNRWGAYDTSVWYGFDQRNSGDSIGTMIIDLGAVYTNLAYIRAYVWPAGASGIAVPQSYDFYISEDGVTYTLVTSVKGEKNDPVWIYTDNTDVLTARYIKLDIVGSASDTFWFIGEIEVNSYDPQIVEDEPIAPPVPNTKVEINVNDEAILTDGETGFTGNWGEVGTGDVLLITNDKCQMAGMDVTLLYALGEAKKIDSVTIDLYHCAGVMIGYPEGQAIVLVSTDGETYTEIGKFDLTAAEVANGAYGTVSSTFEFDAVEAAYVKVLLYAGSNEAVLGDSPADGKIFWEFISVAEFAVGEVEEAPTYEFGDVNGDGKVNTADYVVLKRHIMNTYELNEDQLTRANINGDTKINTADYVLLKRFIMGTWEPN